MVYVINEKVGSEMMRDWIEDHLLGKVEKPLRYQGNEMNAVHKDWDSTTLRMVFGFPDIYEIGMSHLGLSILYHQACRHGPANAPPRPGKTPCSFLPLRLRGLHPQSWRCSGAVPAAAGSVRQGCSIVLCGRKQWRNCSSRRGPFLPDPAYSEYCCSSSHTAG